jgi:pyrroline-5-carboxylate reductase
MNTTIGFIGTGNIAAAVVEGLVTAWAKNDADGASSWLAALSPGSLRDAGLAAFNAVAQAQAASAAEF